MKIIQIIYSLNQGGAERFVVDLSNELSKNNEVYLITLRDDKEKNCFFYKNEVAKNVNYINFPLKKGFRLTDVYKVSKFIKKINADIIHTHLDVVYYFLPFSLFNSKRKIFHTVHNDAYFDGRNKFASSIRKIFYKQKLIVPITISKDSQHSFENFYSIKNPLLIYNGRNSPSTTNQLEEVIQEINSLKKHTKDLVFIHVSRYNEKQKNHSMLINVFNQLSLEGLNAILLIIGRDYQNKAQDLILNSGDRIFYLGEKKNIIDYLNCSDGFFLSSFYEGLPISLLEAIACGCIPVCTPAGGIKDVISNRVNGFIAKNFTSLEYKKTICEFLKFRHDIDKTKMFETFEQKYSIQNCAEEHMKIYSI